MQLHALGYVNLEGSAERHLKAMVTPDGSIPETSLLGVILYHAWLPYSGPSAVEATAGEGDWPVFFGVRLWLKSYYVAQLLGWPGEGLLAVPDNGS